MADTKTNWHYVPTLEDVLSPPPAPLPEAASVASSVRTDTAWLILTVANVLVTGILVTGMIVDGRTASRAIVWGVIYFLGSMSFFVAVLTGTLTDITRSAQRERTERQRIDAYAQLAEKALDWRLAVESNRQLELQQGAPADVRRRLAALEDSLPADPMQTPSFVQPYDNRPKGAFAAEVQPLDTTAHEALKWARGLYTDIGAPNGERLWLTNKKESHGRIRGEVIGSKRGGGSNEARLWLLHRRVIVKRPGGYALNIALFPERDDLRYVK